MPIQTAEIVAEFTEEDAWLREEVPKPKTVPIVSPISVVLGVSDKVLEDTVFTKVKMENADFRATPKKLPRLIFISKERLLENPALAGELSPLVLVLENRNGGPFFTLCSGEAEKKLAALMRHNYLLLPLYISGSRGLQPWGTDIVFRDRFYAAPGKLRMRAVGCVFLCLFGKRHLLSGSEYGLVDFWNHPTHWQIKILMEKRLIDHDVEESIETSLEASC